MPLDSDPAHAQHDADYKNRGIKIVTKTVTDPAVGWFVEHEPTREAAITAVNKKEGPGLVSISFGAQGIISMGQTDGILGQTSADNCSGVVGEHSGSGAGVSGRSKSGDGVYGAGAQNGVHGVTSGANWSGVSGEHKGNEPGAGVAGTSEAGVGVYGRGGAFACQFDGKSQFDGDMQLNGNLNVTGGLTVTGNCNANDYMLADCAEDFDVAKGSQVEPGTVMVINDSGALEISSSSYDKRVAGVISGAGKYRPALILDKQKSNGVRMPVALIGKVYCKVDAQYSPIGLGDLLTTSPTLGHAMKVSDPSRALGTVIGKALGALDCGQGMIPILVALQ